MENENYYLSAERFPHATKDTSKKLLVWTQSYDQIRFQKTVTASAYVFYWPYVVKWCSHVIFHDTWLVVVASTCINMPKFRPLENPVTLRTYCSGNGLIILTMYGMKKQRLRTIIMLFGGCSILSAYPCRMAYYLVTKNICKKMCNYYFYLFLCLFKKSNVMSTSFTENMQCIFIIIIF